MATKNNVNKPLPIPPRQPDSSFRLTTTLSIEARDHARRFILHAFEEESSTIARDDWEAEKECWVSGFLDAMDALGESIAVGGWLAGVRRSRKMAILHRTSDKTPKSGSLVNRLDVQGGSSQNSSEPSDKGGTTPRGTLEQLNHLLSKPTVPTPKPSHKHMLLTTGVFGAKHAIPNEDMGFDLIPSRIGCMFTPNVFLLPWSEESSPVQDVNAGVVLYGLDEWDVDTENCEQHPTRIVGGNFSFKGVTSISQHASLCKILRLSVYVHLSLILEQHLLSDSHVKLNLPKQRPPRALPPAIAANDRRRTSSDSGRKSRDSILPSGVWSFFSKKTEDLLNRATGFRSERSSVDISKEPVIHGKTPGLGESTHHRTRTFSFLPDSIPWTTRVRKEVDDFAAGPPFRAALRRIEKSQELLSTTAGLIIPLPSLLASLADKEDKDPSRRLTGAERSGLNSVLGWEGRDARGKGMAGIYGFVKQQEVCVLYSEHVSARGRSPSVAGTSDTVSTNSNISATATTTDHPNPAAIQCGGRARWMCFQYYSRRKGADKTLGETIVRMCSVAEDPCGNAGCQTIRGDHELRFIHGGVRIAVDTELIEGATDEDHIDMWESCKQCGETTTKSRMSDGTFLLSFGKYVELLVYSPNLHVLYPPLCEHTQIHPKSMHISSPATSDPRSSIVRHFSYQTHQVNFSLSFIDDIFDIHVPRIQFTRAGGMDTVAVTTASTTGQSTSGAVDPKRILRKEILRWWQDVSEHMDRLEEIFVQQDDLRAVLKSLPRLPSADDPFDDFDNPDLEATPKAAISGLPSPGLPQQEAFYELTPSSRPSVNSLPPEKQYPAIGETNTTVTQQSSSSNTLSHTPQDHIKLLSSLRHDFQREERGLYVQLSRTPMACLNNVRRAFLTSAQGAMKRLSAWEAKHVPKGAPVVVSLSTKQPSWWESDCHAVPGGNVIVREGDWGSIIAFTLSSQDYLKELAAMSFGKASVHMAPSQPPPMPPRPSMFTRSSYRLFSSSRPAPDPDDARVVWQEQEVYSAVISRKEHPRDPSAILSFKDVLRKAPVDGNSLLSPSRFATPARVGTPPSAWAKPAVEINMQPAAGQVEVLDKERAIGRILHEVDAVYDKSSSRAATSGSTAYDPSILFETHIRREKSSSIFSSSGHSDGTANAAEDGNPQTPDFPLPHQLHKTGLESSDIDNDSNPDVSTFMGSSLTGSIAQMMRYMLNAGEQKPTSSLAKNHHGLLSSDSPIIDERPHIKYDLTIGKRLKFSCTVYYAKQFDTLRRRCNIEDVFLKSMEKSDNWTAEGGKSRSNFWKTSDDQFIIKTLVNAWNVADLQVLIELGPSYFRYIDSTVGKPTVLAKLLGFYTVEIRNLETGTIQAKADLLVMENLFYNKKIVRTFDLKGIQGRKAKVKGNSTGSKTLLDGDWIEGQQRALTLLRPHSKLVLQEAIKSDSDYLSKSNIMDYSLLLGIDVERKQIACGLVDTIGSYTIAKTLEYKAKQNLKSGKEVTVIPPNEYQERFVSAMDEYFLACPDKWSKPLDDTKVISDPNLLPSVL